jgi:uncharacterized protein (DUF58 family)
MSSGTVLQSGLLQRLERLSLATRRRLSGGGAGDRRSVLRGSSLDFADYRSYVPGDQPERVDWNIYSRSGSLFVKQFDDEQLLTVHLLLDTSPSMDWGEPNKLAYARQLTGALGYIALTGHNRVLASSLGERVVASFGPAWGRAQWHGLQAFLTAPAHKGGTDLDRALGAHANKASRPGLAVLVSDLLTPQWEQGVKQLLARRYEVVILHLLAPQEVHPDLSGDLELYDRESGDRVDVTLNQDALDEYQERYRAWCRRLETFSARYGVLYHRIESSEPLERLLFTSLRKRGVLR